MAHRALTLKYRPQVFTDVIGQDHVSRVLSRAVEGGRIAHAFLFTGARGVGKTTSARILAKSLNCRKRLAGELTGSDPCNECTSCTEITAGVSLDVTEIDGASNRGIADVQALRERVRFAPTGGGYRVVIIDEVHQLSNDAFAALLKTLEEPPPHVVFIFATTDPQKLPDTIRSRCQRFDFARVPLRKVADRLLAIAAREQKDPEGVRFTLEEGAALLIAHKSEGSMRDAVSALDQVVSAGEPGINEELVRRVLGLADREVFFDLAGAIVGRDPKAALRALHQAFEKGLDARELAEGLTEHIRHMLILRVDPEGADLVALASEDLARLRAQAASWTEADLLRLLKIASEVQWPMRDSPHPLVHLEAAVLQMATLEPGETLAELLARLEALEQRFLGGAGGSPPAGPASAPARGAAAPGTRPPAAAEAAPPASRTVPRTPSPGTPRASGAAVEPAPSPAGTSTALATAEPAVVRDPAAEASWLAALTAIKGRKAMLGAFLEESRFAGVELDTVIVAMDDLHRTVVEDRENRALLIEELTRAFGRPMGLKCAGAGAETGTARRPATQESVRPLIDRAIAWFQGDIIEPRERGSERTGG